VDKQWKRYRLEEVHEALVEMTLMEQVIVTGELTEWGKFRSDWGNANFVLDMGTDVLPGGDMSVGYLSELPHFGSQFLPFEEYGVEVFPTGLELLRRDLVETRSRLRLEGQGNWETAERGNADVCCYPDAALEAVMFGLQFEPDHGGRSRFGSRVPWPAGL
jgi:hypothetical protein